MNAARFHPACAHYHIKSSLFPVVVVVVVVVVLVLGFYF
jgi:hypothetical protein